MADISKITTSDGVQHGINAATVGGHTVNVNVPSDAMFTDTDTKVTQNTSSANADYRVLLSGSANDANETTTANKSGSFTYNPSTGSAALSGKLTVGSSPSNNMDVATKQYVDTRYVVLTQQEWDDLPSSKYSDNIIYFINDSTNNE